MERAAATAHLDRARELYNIKRYDLAIASALDAIAADQNDASAHVLLANSYERLRRLPEAAAAAKRAIELEPERASAHLAIGMVLFAQRKYPSSAVCFHEAIRLAPTYADAYRMLAHACLMRRHFADGLESIGRALEFAPYSIHAHEVRILLLSAAGRPMLAEAAVATLLSIDPENALALRQEGMLRLVLGGPRDAMTPLREALRVDPNAAAGRSVYAQGVIGTSFARHLLPYAYAVFLTLVIAVAISGQEPSFATTAFLYCGVFAIRRAIVIEVLRRDAIAKSFLRPSELAYNRLAAALAAIALAAMCAAAYDRIQAVTVFAVGTLATAIVARAGRSSPPAVRDAPHRVSIAIFVALTAVATIGTVAAGSTRVAERSAIGALAIAFVAAGVTFFTRDREACLALMRALIPGRRASPLT